MVGRAKSVAKKQQEASEEKAEWQRIAVERYRAELEKLVKERKGARRICEEVEIEHKVQTRRSIHLNHATIIRHADGGKPLREFNAEKRWLSDEEEEMVLRFSEETAARGFPLSHRQLRKHVNQKHGQIGLLLDTQIVFRLSGLLHSRGSCSFCKSNK